jgi:hypothetical protein
MNKLICLVAFAAVGCQGAGSLYRSEGYQERPLINASLVKDDKAMLSEEAIRTLLGARIRIPERVKLAVLPLAHQGEFAESSWTRGSTRPVEFIQEHKQYLAALEAPLAATGRFSEITHVPPLMLSDDPSLTRLRETAALMQAELLLVYATRCQMISKRAFLAADRVKATASIELILLDVRTGVVPYAETFDVEHVERENSDDYSMVDTQRRAERTATTLVMARAADGLRRFLAP